MIDFIQIILILFYVATGIQLFYLVVFYGRLVFFNKPAAASNHFEPVSIVIAAKNEYLKLKKFLPLLLTQDYPEYEVIVVNDNSTDDTEFLLKEFQFEYPHLQFITVNGEGNFFNGKKFPLSIGIKSAHHDLLLLTDADCIPASNQWIKGMQAAYQVNTEIVLGYGAYQEQKGLLNKLIRYDTLRVALSYFSFAKWKIPYMGVGRNLSYRKKLFYEQKGFMSHYKISSGDDDLFINKAANSKNTGICLNPDSKTISLPKQSFGDWVAQKRRHLTTGIYYKKLHLSLLAISDISLIIFYLSAVYLLIKDLSLYQVYIFLTLRFILHILITKKFMLIVGERKLLLFSPSLELLITVVGPVMAIYNMLYKQRKWK
jgi:glycosyltransferase involved in cell wall biosynthesis